MRRKGKPGDCSANNLVPTGNRLGHYHAPFMAEPAHTAAQFYVTGGSLRADSPCYVERQADDDLCQGLLQGEFCYVLTSRQMGKSSLMVRTAHKLREQGVSVAVLDLTAFGQNVTPEQWYDGLLSRVGRQLRLEDEFEDFWREHTRYGPCQRFFMAIREVALRRSPGRLVVFVDELDMVRSLPFKTDELFAAIRECYGRRDEDPEFNRLAFCLLGVATPSQLIADVNVTPFNIGRRIELNDFIPREAARLISGLAGARDDRPPWDSERLLAHILAWTGGHPYLTQRLCRAVSEASTRRPPPALDTTLVDHLCEELFLSPRARERDDNLLFVRDRLVRCGCDLRALLDLYERIRSGGAVDDDETNECINHLRLSGITRAKGRQLAVRNRIYHEVFDSRWIGSARPAKAVVPAVPRSAPAFPPAPFRSRRLLWGIAAAAIVLLALGVLLLLGRQELPVRGRAIDLEAKQLYEMARFHWNKRTREGVTNALAYYQQAIARSPAYARAHAGLGDAYLFLATRSEGEVARQWIAGARQAAQTALRFDSSVTEAHATLGKIQGTWDWDVAAANRSFAEAIRLDSNNVVALYWGAWNLAMSGQVRPAMDLALRATRVAPTSASAYFHAALVARVLGRNEEGLRWARRAEEFEPELSGLDWLRAALELQAGNQEAAVERSIRFWRGFIAPEDLAELEPAFVRGGLVEFHRVLAAAVEKRGPRDVSRLMHLPFLYAHAGDKEKLLYWLERSYEARTPDQPVIAVAEAFKPFRSEPRFQALVEKIRKAPPLTALPTRSSPVRKSSIVEAQDAYAAGWQLWRRRAEGAALLTNSIVEFERAVKLDPNFALAWAALASAYTVLPAHTETRPGDIQPRIDQSVERALALGPDLPETHFALAGLRMSYLVDLAGAEAAFLKTLDLDPGFTAARHWLLWVYVQGGRTNDAFAEIERIRQNPREFAEPIAQLHIAWAWYWLRNYPAATTAAEQFLKVAPSGFYALLLRAFIAKASGDEQGIMPPLIDLRRTLGASREELAALEKLFAARNPAGFWREIRQQETAAARLFDMPNVKIAMAMLAGESAEALHQLDNQMPGDMFDTGRLCVDPIYDPIRADAVFQHALRRLKAPCAIPLDAKTRAEVAPR